MSAVTTVRVLRGAMLAAAWIVSAGSARAQSADVLFDAAVLQEVRLFINERDLEELRTRYQENAYYPADLHWGDARVRNVGIRSRGKGSRNPVKLGLHVEFGHYVAGQRFLDLSALDLDNLWQDASMLRDHAAMALFTRMGQPAPRESFARLTINGRYQGVYALVEPLDAAFLARAAGGADGYLFEYRWIDEYGFTDLGDDPAALEARFERRTRRTDPRTTAYAPLAEMIHAINAVQDDAWQASVERYVDMRQFLTHVAIEQFLSEHDGLTGYEGLNNFYLHRPAASTRHQFLPWDRDYAFQDAQSSIFLRAERNVLLRRALAIDELRAFYLGMLERCAETASSNRWLERVIVSAASLIADAAAADPLKPHDETERTDAVEHVIEFARVRPAAVREAVAAARTTGRASAARRR